jgi:uncharacterized protein YndB with AHSA1/START domain
MDFTIDIASPVEQVFALIADLPNYPRWLPPSGLYAGTTEASETPITLGTTYVDHSKPVPLRGNVTEYRSPHAISFHQETRSLLGRLSVDAHYRLEAHGAGTRLYRTTTPRLSGVLALLSPMILRSIGAENTRTLAMMKRYLEEQA